MIDAYELKEHIIEDAKKFNESDFFISFDLCSTLDNDMLAAGGAKIIGEPVLFNSFQFRHTNGVLKLAAGQYTFIPIYDEKTFSSCFSSSNKFDISYGIVVVSHKLKQCGVFYAEDIGNGNIQYNRYPFTIMTNVYGKATNTNIYVGMLASVNPMLMNYDIVLNCSVMNIRGMYHNIDDFFAYESFENRYVSDKMIEQLNDRIDDLNKTIRNVEHEIECVKLNNKKYETGMYKARVEFDLNS